jgi:outer membrane protein assembly factor BamB
MTTRVYITEAGMGGDEPLVMPEMEGETSATPVDAESTVIDGLTDTRGHSGQITMVAPDGTQSVLVDGLASYLLHGFEAIGPAGIAVADGQLIVANGGAGPLTAVTDPIQYENQLLSIDPASGEITVLADIGAYERANNPDPHNIDSNLYGVAIAADGTIYVNDAGGNTTYRVPAGGGDPEVVAVHPGIAIPDDQAPPGGNPGRGGENELDPVPTDIEVLDDGTVLSALLSGGPFPPGASKVVSITDDGTISDVATGLTMTVALTVGPDGHLYATQISTNFLGEVPEPGNVVRLLEDGTQEIVVDGLVLPNGIAFDNDGNLLVVTNAVSIGGPTGQVLRCEGVTQVASEGEVEIALRDVYFRSR